MAKRGIAEILEEVSKASDRQTKINILRQNDNQALRWILRMAFDKNLVWDLPPGAPPYKPCEQLDQEGNLYNEIKRFYLFHKGGNPNLKSAKRETLFIQMLEYLHPKDAALVCAVKEKKLPYKGITEKLISEALPGTVDF
jgi:hypothetical protein